MNEQPKPDAAKKLADLFVRRIVRDIAKEQETKRVQEYKKAS